MALRRRLNVSLRAKKAALISSFMQEMEAAVLQLIRKSNSSLPSGNFG
jgi:hypothetical protein